MDFVNKILAIVILTIISTSLYSQDLISNDGKYVCVKVQKSNEFQNYIMVIHSTQSRWKKEIIKGKEAMFSPDCKYLFFKSGDSLIIQTLSTDKQVCIPQVVSYKQPKNGNGEWIAYKLQSPANELLVYNLFTGKEQQFKDILDYRFNDNGSALLLKCGTKKDSLSVSSLYWVDLRDDKITTIWAGKEAKVSDYIFDAGGDQLAFMVKMKEDADIANAIWYYKKGMDKAVNLANNRSIGIANGTVISEAPLSFSKKGSRIYFYLKEGEIPTPKGPLSKVDVWSYTDPKLQTLQLKDVNVFRKYAATIDISQHRIIRIEQENEKLLAENYMWGNISGPQINDEYALICHFESDIFAYDTDFNGEIMEVFSMDEFNWNKATQSSVYLISLQDGSRKLLNSAIKATYAGFPYYRFSPGGKFVVYFDTNSGKYFSYEISTGIFRSITQLIDVPLWMADRQKGVSAYYRPRGIAQWEDNDSSVFIWDHYGDIWKVNLFNTSKPINFTNSFARKNNILYLEPENYQKPFSADDKLFFNAICKNGDYINNGYYYKYLNSEGDPKTLIKIGGRYKFRLKKAANASVYLIERENVEEPPNFVYTKDFKTYNSITSNQTETRKGIKQEIVTWKTFDGTVSKGVLRFPDNFNPQKKYPIIFYYYEKDVLWWNVFRSYGEGIVEDHGYLLFAPDIHYTIGETGKSVYNCVVSAAKYLSKRPYVDNKRMGIVGGSFSGYETNYLITHTSIFAAASSSCGVSNFLSYYGANEIDEGGKYHSADTEIGQHKIGVTLWERPDLYIKNSPVFYTDRVNTPLLLWHNRNDNRVPFEQSIEFFKALRRLGKRVWLIQQDGEGHSGANLGFTCDLLCKFTAQFFDHYLKGTPAPKWMLKNTPARLKGIETVLELDSTGKTPGPGLLMDEEIKTPQQKELLEYRTILTNEGKVVNVPTTNLKNQNKNLKLKKN